MKKIYSILGLLGSLSISAQNCSVLCNGGFDSTNLAGSTVALITATNVPCWKTTSPDNKIEVWANGYNGINSYSGIQFIEVNATAPCTVYQNFIASSGSSLSVSFAHRARGSGNDVDSIEVFIGAQGGPYVSLGRFGDGVNVWAYRTLNYTVPAGIGSNLELRFKSLYVGNGNPAIGNFLDAVKICSSSVPNNCNIVCNGGFDNTNLAGSTVGLITATNVPCWKTTSPDNKIEVWANGYNGINSYSGIQFIEVNATAPCTVYQDFTSTGGTPLSVSFAHRARGSGNDIDSIQVSVGPQGGPYVSLGRFGDGINSWTYRTLNYILPTGAGSNFELRFTSLYVGNGNSAIGNFLDAVEICSTTVGVKEYKVNTTVVLAPNPCTNEFNIKLLNSTYIAEKLNLNLYDSQGKLVKEYVKEMNSELINFNIKGLTSGIYYYQGNMADQNISGKLIVVE